MLTRIRTEVVRQPDARLRRTWYHGLQEDVVLVHDAGTGDFVSFEIEWQEPGARRAYVTWGRAVGLRTGWIDTGDSGDALSYKRAPIVGWDPVPRPDRLEAARRLVRRAGVEEGLREWVLARLG
jgi:hypothetical protein